MPIGIAMAIFAGLILNSGESLADPKAWAAFFTGSWGAVPGGFWNVVQNADTARLSLGISRGAASVDSPRRAGLLTWRLLTSMPRQQTRSCAENSRST